MSPLGAETSKFTTSFLLLFFVDPPKPKIEEIGSLRWTFGDRPQSIKIQSHQPEKSVQALAHLHPGALGEQLQFLWI